MKCLLTPDVSLARRESAVNEPKTAFLANDLHNSAPRLNYEMSSSFFMFVTHTVLLRGAVSMSTAMSTPQVS